MKIDVIIPTYKPGKELFDLLDRLENQSLPVNKIILMNTERRFFEGLISEEEFASRYANVEVHHLKKEEFDHGATRHAGVQCSDADVFILMTQDAMPVDGNLTENLTKHLNGRVAAAYGRQLPRENCTLPERISREFNYPERTVQKGSEDLERMGIKTYFCSNVCAAYRREIYDEMGGFIRHTIFNEDMIFAAGAIQKGYLISYEADAKVIHSHNFTCMQQLHRNFDLGVSQADHPEIFSGVKSESEGKKYVKSTIKALVDHKKPYLIPGFILQCCFKYAGYLAGKRYRMLPAGLVRALSDNKSYWK
ncbi:MAG: glycosyltransferase [Lachnospiraceae bacterium]|nr:glycosyltransferase [Lachnospiraceae bacterium]